MNALQKLRQQVGIIKDGSDGLAIVDAWALSGRLLARMPVPAGELERVLQEKDPDGLDAIVTKLENPGDEPEQTPEEVSEKEMRDALRAFRKRLKLIRLNDESKLGGHGMTSGKKSQINSMEPPKEHPRRVWKSLARAGWLVDEGHGFYSEALRPPDAKDLGA